MTGLKAEHDDQCLPTGTNNQDWPRTDLEAEWSFPTSTNHQDWSELVVEAECWFGGTENAPIWPVLAASPGGSYQLRKLILPPNQFWPVGKNSASKPGLASLVVHILVGKGISASKPVLASPVGGTYHLGNTVILPENQFWAVHSASRPVWPVKGRFIPLVGKGDTQSPVMVACTSWGRVFL